MSQAQHLIDELSSLVGVQGAFLFDPQGTIQLYSSPIKLAPERGVALARTLARTLTGLSTIQRSNLVDLDLAYGEGRLVIKGLPGGGLCILCDRQLNYSLLNITLEQGLRAMRDTSVEAGSSQTHAALDQMIMIANEMLGEHAPKVISILQNTGTGEAELTQAITQAEKLTRMFIDKEQAGQMAQRMRELLEHSG